ncbi:MAG: pitrilysin family protein [Pseudomonadota bacterium]
MDVQTTRLPNGLTVVTDRMAHLKSAALGVWVNAGSRSETVSQHGLAHLLEHMAFKGTKTRSALQIAEEIEAVGGELNAATSIESTAYYARVLSENVPLAVDILSDILQNATIDAEELGKEQHVILQEIGAAHDTPEDLVFDRFQETAYPDQAIGRPILGTPESVAAFDSTAIADYLSTHYRAGSMVVSAAGDIDHDHFVDLVSSGLSQVHDAISEPPETSTYVGGEWVENRDLQEAQIVLGFEGRAYHHEDFFTTQMLAAVLGGGMSSRLFQEVREKRGLCYSVYAFHWGYSDTGLFGIHAATGSEDIEQIMPVIIDELHAIRSCLKQEEVDRAKAQMRASLLMSLESPAARAGQMARHILLFGRPLTPEEQIEKLDAVTPADIMRVAHMIFSESRPTLAAIGPVDKLLSVDDIQHRLDVPQAAE